MDDVATIAAGGQPSWKKTVNHPKYGELVFAVPKLPTNSQWFDHANRTDTLIVEHGGDPDTASTSTKTLSAALAAMQVIPGRPPPLMQVPVLDEEHEVDPDNPTHERIVKTFYDPLQDESLDLAMEVWLAFMAWRLELLDKVGEVGKDSGETPGPESDASSPERTTSPPTIPDSESGQTLTT